MKLLIGPLQLDRPAIEDRWDVLLGVVADFSVNSGERRLLHEEMFPVVELSVALGRWLDELDTGVINDFSFESLESAAGPLLQFVRKDDAWTIHSPLQEFEDEHTFTTEQVRGAAHEFIEDVRRAAAAQLNLELDRWLRA